jgi:peptidoglycan/LPS O-acetylase OafA/YrhL
MIRGWEPGRSIPQEHPGGSARESCNVICSSRPVQTALGYRRDIDGLRAIAVLSVVFFHAGLSGFSGGFVGVDIFFVISGYLITLIIVRGLEAERFSIAWFYERRVRRIIPAFIVVVAATVIGATVFLFPKDLIEFGRSAFAAALFASNFFFASRTGYFAPAHETMPLLHTWSLGVEEQFYIVWPLVLWACFRLGCRRSFGVVVFVLAAASLSYAEWAIRNEDPDIVFFLPQARAWELMFGAILALGLVPELRARWIREALAVLGAALLAFGITQFSVHTPFPGLWATIPALGAALLLHTGRQGDTAISKLLGFWPCVFIGLISYSVYLWHWPLFAFAKVYLGHSPSEGVMLALIVATIIIATASWWFVERPFRQSAVMARISPQLLFAGGLGSLAVTGCIGLVLVFAHGLPNRIGHGAQRFYFEGRRTIQLSQHAADILVWGDSHAEAFARAALIIGQHYGLTVGESGTHNCPPLIGAHRVGGSYSRDCDAINRALLEQLQRGPRPRVAILVARWSLYQGGRTQEGPVFEIDDQEQTLDAETSTRVVARALGRTVDALEALGIAVVLVGQAPEFPEHPNSCVVRRIWHKEPNAADCLTMPREQSDRRLSTSKAILTELAKTHKATLYVGLDSILCEDHQTCRAAEDHRPLYHDDNHLSLFGSYVVGRKLAGRRSALLPLFAELGASPIDPL